MRKKEAVAIKSNLYVHDFKNHPVKLLLYKSTEHYHTWRLLRDIPEDEKEQIMQTGKIKVRERLQRYFTKHLPHTEGSSMPEEVDVNFEFWVPPKVIDSADLDQDQFTLILQEYNLANWEREEGFCPFCRVTKMKRRSLILSDRHSMGTLERGGVIFLNCPCQFFDVQPGEPF